MIKTALFDVKTNLEKGNLSIETLGGEKAKDAGQEQKLGRSMEVPWYKNNLNYMSCSEAIVKFTGSKMPASTLSNFLKQDGHIHYMRKGQRCRVHIGEFIKYAKEKYPPDDIAAEITDEYMADIEARKQRERNK